MKYTFLILSFAAVDAGVFLLDQAHGLHLGAIDYGVANLILLGIGWITHYFRVV